jgi:O-antigen/teichoic acid export membrane protein
LTREPPAESSTVTGQGRRVFRNVAAITVGKIGADICTFLMFVVISRQYGQEGIGRYSVAMAFTGVFVVLGNFGLGELLVKTISRRTTGFGEYVGQVLAIYGLAVGTIIALFGLTLPFLPLDTELKRVIAVIGVYNAGYAVIAGMRAVFTAREAMHLGAALELSLRLTTAVLGISLAVSGQPLVVTVASLPAMTFVHVILGYVMLSRRFGRFRLRLNPGFALRTLRESRIYGMATLLNFVAQRLDVICLGAILGAAAAGLYNVSYRLVFFLMMLSQLGSQSVFPLATRLFLNSRSEQGRLYRRSVRMVILACLPAAGGLALIAADLVPAIYTDAFRKSVPILQLLTVALFVVCLRSVVDVFMLACDLQVARTKLRWISVGLNLTGNLLLIPLLGIAGAAIATIVAESVLTISSIVRLKPLLGWPRVGSRLLIAGASTAAFCALYWALSPISLIVAIPGWAAVYAAALLSFPSIRHDEGSLLREILRGN